MIISQLICLNVLEDLGLLPVKHMLFSLTLSIYLLKIYRFYLFNFDNTLLEK